MSVGLLSNYRAVKLGSVALLGLGGVAAYQVHKAKEVAMETDNLNYTIKFERPPGWTDMMHTPMMKFLWKAPGAQVEMKGAIQQTISDDNPTPELTTKSFAKAYVTSTKENLAGWTATTLPDYQAKNVTFSLIERTAYDRKLVSALFIKGNTTIILSLYGYGKDKDSLDKYMSQFKGFLDSVVLVKQHIDP